LNVLIIIVLLEITESFLLFTLCDDLSHSVELGNSIEFSNTTQIGVTA